MDLSLLVRFIWLIRCVHIIAPGESRFPCICLSQLLFDWMNEILMLHLDINIIPTITRVLSEMIFHCLFLCLFLFISLFSHVLLVLFSVDLLHFAYIFTFVHSFMNSFHVCLFQYCDHLPSILSSMMCRNLVLLDPLRSCPMHS